MRIQQEVASDLTIRQLVADRTRRHKLVTVLLHTLDSMGFTHSLQQLQEESNIRLQPSAQHELKLLFQQGKYTEAEAVVQNLPLLQNLKLEISQTLLELKLLKLIDHGEYQPAIQLLAGHWSASEERQLEFLQMIATGQPVSSQQVSSRQLQVLQKCQAESFELKASIEQMLKGYLGLAQGEAHVSVEQEPPCNIVAQSQAIHNAHFSFARLHPRGRSLCLVAETNSAIEISLWAVQNKNIRKLKVSNLEGLGWVHTVQWNSGGDTLALCTYTKVALISADSLPFKPFMMLNTSDIASGKLLCAKWSPSDQLYIGGLFENLTIIDSKGKIVHSVRPFLRTRDLVFLGDGELVAISATQPIVSKLRVEEEEVISRFESKHCFMSIARDEKGEKLAVANRESVFLLDADTLTLLASFKSPDNPKMWKIEVFLLRDWLIIFNQQLTATTVAQNQVVRHHTWADCQAMHLQGQRMVTVGTKVVLWQTAQHQHGDSHSRNLAQQSQWGLQLQQQRQNNPAQFLSSSSEEQSIQAEEDESMEQEEQIDINLEEGSNDLEPDQAYQS